MICTGMFFFYIVFLTLPQPFMMIPLLDDESYWSYPCRDNLIIPFMHYWYRCLFFCIVDYQTLEVHQIANAFFIDFWQIRCRSFMLDVLPFRLVTLCRYLSYMMITTKHNDKHMSKLLSSKDEQFLQVWSKTASLLAISTCCRISLTLPSQLVVCPVPGSYDCSLDA